jgi:hypothetical protein
MSQTQGQDKKMTPAGKVGFVALLFFAVFTVGLGFMQMRNTIYGPFIIHPRAEGESISAYFGSQEDLTKKDTDRDGLSDYEELEFHLTSPYLADTDSDGVSDRDEIAQGTDPLCSAGQVCGGGSSEVGEGEKVNPVSPLLRSTEGLGLDNLFNTASSAMFGLDSYGGAGSTGEVINVPNMNQIMQDPIALRKLLSDTGIITPEQLSTIDDATLIRMAKEMFAKQGVSKIQNP